MPELPDVEVYRRYMNATALHQQIDSVDIRSDQILDESSRSIHQCLEGQSFESTRRHGKYLFVHLGDNDALVLHFGMTGDLKYFKDPEDEPEYTQLLIHFANNYHMALIMPRKLGAVRCTSDIIDAFIREKELGPDVLDDISDFKGFQDILDGHRGMVKSTLMNQKIIAGIGNVYSDEILFQAEVHPRQTIDELDQEVMQTIFTKTGNVLRTAIDRDADPDQFPDSWITPRRNEAAACPRCGGEVGKIKVSGRSAYYCPNCQSM